jgi:hypothetical protein
MILIFNTLVGYHLDISTDKLKKWFGHLILYLNPDTMYIEKSLIPFCNRSFQVLFEARPEVTWNCTFCQVSPTFRKLKCTSKSSILVRIQRKRSISSRLAVDRKSVEIPRIFPNKSRLGNRALISASIVTWKAFAAPFCVEAKKIHWTAGGNTKVQNSCSICVP